MESRIQQVSGLFGVAGLLLGAVQNFTSLSVVMNNNFWLVYGVAMIMSLYAFWPEPAAEDRLRIIPLEKAPWLDGTKRFLKVILIVVFGIMIAAHHVWDLSRAVTGPRPYPDPATPIGLDFNSLLVRRAEAAPSSAPKLIQFALQQSKTSFAEQMEALHAAGRQIRTFSLSYDAMSIIWNKQCAPEFRPRESSVRDSLIQFATQNGRAQLVQYIPDRSQSLASLVDNRPDVTQQLLPQRDEWERMPPQMREDILFWIKSCIGIPFPVFILTVENKRDTDLVITSIVYRVKSIGQVAGGESGPMGPKVTYVHKLRYERGEQRQTLDSPFRIVARSAESFGLQLSTDEPDLGLTWEMKIRLESNQGPIETDYFQLIMSGRPSWAKSKFK